MRASHPSPWPLPACKSVSVLFHYGALVDVVVVVAVMLLDGRMGVLGLIVMTVPMDRDTAGTDVQVLGECADWAKHEGSRGGHGGNREIHPHFHRFGSVSECTSPLSRSWMVSVHAQV